jgi:hypothetical protein
LTPAFYGQLLDVGGRLNLKDEAVIVVGIAGLFFLVAPAVSTLLGMPTSVGGWRWWRFTW